MVKFSVETVEGESKDLKLMDYVPTRVGIKARSKLNVGLEGDKSKANIQMENALEKADEAMLYVVEEMLDRGDTELTVDDLAYKSFQEVGKHYWSQIQGEKAKN